MPAKFFKCSDGETIEIEKCLSVRGCRLKSRCAPLQYLRAVSFDREWKGVTPSSAGSDARMLYLKAVTPYIINPTERVWAILGLSGHERLAQFSDNVFSEEGVQDEEIEGILDLLEEDEYSDTPGYILWDHKFWGSFKVAKGLGITIKTTDEKILDKDGNPVLLKSGENKGKPKTHKVREIKQTSKDIDLRAEEYQTNRYRIIVEQKGFKVTKIKLFVPVRDGGLYIAKNRGIEKNYYILPVKRLLDNKVLKFYRDLNKKVDAAFKDKYAPKCQGWSNWEGRRCTEKFCEIYFQCQQMGN